MLEGYLDHIVPSFDEADIGSKRDVSGLQVELAKMIVDAASKGIGMVVAPMELDYYEVQEVLNVFREKGWNISFFVRHEGEKAYWEDDTEDTYEVRIKL